MNFMQNFKYIPEVDKNGFRAQYLKILYSGISSLLKVFLSFDGPKTNIFTPALTLCHVTTMFHHFS